MKKLSKRQINIITDSIIYHLINDADTVMLDETDLSIDIKDEVKGFDFGLGLGAGYWFTEKIGANVRYVAGLSDIAKDNEGGDAAKNNGFQVGLNYKF